LPFSEALGLAVTCKVMKDRVLDCCSSSYQNFWEQHSKECDAEFEDRVVARLMHRGITAKPADPLFLLYEASKTYLYRIEDEPQYEFDAHIVGVIERSLGVGYEWDQQQIEEFKRFIETKSKRKIVLFPEQNRVAICHPSSSCRIDIWDLSTKVLQYKLLHPMTTEFEYLKAIYIVDNRLVSCSDCHCCVWTEDATSGQWGIAFQHERTFPLLDSNSACIYGQSLLGLRSSEINYEGVQISIYDVRNGQESKITDFDCNTKEFVRVRLESDLVICNETLMVRARGYTADDSIVYCMYLFDLTSHYNFQVLRNYDVTKHYQAPDSPMIFFTSGRTLEEDKDGFLSYGLDRALLTAPLETCEPQLAGAMRQSNVVVQVGSKYCVYNITTGTMEYCLDSLQGMQYPLTGTGVVVVTDQNQLLVVTSHGVALEAYSLCGPRYL
jgi:hypothetical protein